MFGVDEICVENLGHNSNEITLSLCSICCAAGGAEQLTDTAAPTSQQLGYSGE